jgi:hypothetical protein
MKELLIKTLELCKTIFDHYNKDSYQLAKKIYNLEKEIENYKNNKPCNEEKEEETENYPNLEV